MNIGNRKPLGGLAIEASRFLFVLLVLGLSLSGCASKANKDASGKSAKTYKGEVRSAAEQAAFEQEALEGHRSPEAAAAANPNSGIKGTLSKGFAGTWDSGSDMPGTAAANNGATAGSSGKYGRDDMPPGTEWERDLLSGLDPNASSASQLADRVAAARQHAQDIARDTEDATLYAAVTGGRDLHEDMANERALAAREGSDFDPNRDYRKRGFFDEEEYAFAPGMTEAERLAARVEAARRRAGLTDTDEEAVAAFAYGPYSRIYQRDGDVSGLIAFDASGKLKGWATPGELTADGTVFAEGASEKALAQLDAAEGFAGSKGGRRGGSNRNRNGAIDVAASKTNVNEDLIPQTLGGALPMVLGVEENGQFDFDNYFLRDEVKAKLDDLAMQLDGAEYDRLDIRGYTDRIGGVEYNKDLSRKRALAVARYLRDRGVPEYKIMVTGKGQEDPLTQHQDCEGLRFEEMINCLQPDRRVEIEASILRTSVNLE